MRLRIARILRNCATEILGGALAIVRFPQKDSVQVQVLCFGIDGALACETRMLLRRHIGADLFGNGLRHFSL